MRMKVGLFLDLRNPPGWRRPWAEHYARTLELASAADSRGIDALWLSEHHQLADGYLPQPLAMAAALAAVTRTARIGTAVVIAPLRHPRHIAEEAALADLLSNGRLELGLGPGWARPEYTAFGADHEARRHDTRRALEQVQRLLTEVTPPPVQDPLPLWAGFQGPVGARHTGRLGAGLLSLDPRLLAPYRRGLEEGGHHPETHARMGGVVELLVSDDPERTLARIAPFREHQVATYKRPGAAAATAPLPVVLPEQAVEQIQARTDGLPVEHVYLWLSIAGMPDDLVERQLELLVDRVKPRLNQVAAGP
jgi:alkanesulfonate monooxygenase SsuD/methylene tetrahydromethanopterin reductase-like flavin-dependent oxidoreductase (luciferase family)